MSRLEALLDQLIAMEGPRPIDLILGAILLGALVSLLIISRSDKNGFKLTDLLMENGKASKWSVIIMGSWSIHSWALIKWTVVGGVTTADFVTYGAVWITPLIAKMFAKNGDRPAPLESPPVAQAKKPRGEV